MASRRTNVTLPDAPEPSQRLRVIAQPTPVYRSTEEGLEGVSQAFRRFYGDTATALDHVSAALHAGDVAAVKQENLEQRADAIRMAETGEPLSDEQKQDLDYVNTYKTVMAENQAVELNNQFQAELNDLPLTEDGQAFYDQFIQRELKNGVNIGTGDAIYDATLLRTFNKKAQPMIQAHRMAGIKAMRWKNEQDLKAAIANNVDIMEPDDLVHYFSKAQALHPLDPEKAKPAVIDALMAGAGRDPKKAQRVLTLLNGKSTGIGDKSFAESFPAAYAEAEQKMINKYQTGETFAGQEAYEAVRRSITETDDIGTLASIALPGGQLDKVRGRHGEQGQYDSLQKAAVTKLLKLGQNFTEVNRVMNMLTSGAAFDESLYKKHFSDVLNRFQIDPFKNPEGLAEVVARGRNVLPEDLKSEFSSALANLGENNAERFQAAMRFYSAIENRSNEDTALRLMTPDVKARYLYAKRQLLLDPRPYDEILHDLKSNQASIDVASKTTWRQIVGGSGDKDAAEQQVMGVIDDAMDDVLGTDVDVSLAVKKQIMDYAKDVVFQRDIGGNTDWRQAVKDAAKSLKDGITLFPGNDGKVMAEPTLMARSYTENVPVSVDQSMFASVPTTLSPQERNLIAYHRKNLIDGTFLDDEQGLTTVYITGVNGPDGRIYNVPGFADNRRLTPEEALDRAKRVGLNKYPSYATIEEADAAAERVHSVIENDADTFRRVSGQTEPVIKNVVPFGREVTNPDTGEPEDTIATAQNDISIIRTLLKHNDLGGGPIADEDDFAFNGRSAWAPKGVWLLEQNGSPLVIAPGHTVNLGGTSFKLPEDPIEARKAIKEFKLDANEDIGRLIHMDKTINNRVVFVPISADGSAGYMLGYRPGFTNKLPTPKELEAKYTKLPRVKQFGLTSAEAAKMSQRFRRTPKE